MVGIKREESYMTALLTNEIFLIRILPLNLYYCCLRCPSSHAKSSARAVFCTRPSIATILSTAINLRQARQAGRKERLGTVEVVPWLEGLERSFL
jgi:hypothetical protein